jgi:hypothetical protein
MMLGRTLVLLLHASMVFIVLASRYLWEVHSGGDPVEGLADIVFGIIALSTPGHALYAYVHSVAYGITVRIFNGGTGRLHYHKETTRKEDVEVGPTKYYAPYSFTLTSDEFSLWVTNNKGTTSLDKIYQHKDDALVGADEDFMEQIVGNCSVHNLHNALRLGCRPSPNKHEWASMGNAIVTYSKEQLTRVMAVVGNVPTNATITFLKTVCHTVSQEVSQEVQNLVDAAAAE